MKDLLRMSVIALSSVIGSCKQNKIYIYETLVTELYANVGYLG